MAETASRRRIIAVTILRVLLGLVFLTIGTVKLTGSLNTVRLFANIGWGQWFRYFTGAVDVLGGVLVLVSGCAFYGALVLTCTVGFAAVLTFAGRIHDSAVPPLVLTGLAATVAWLTRRRQANI